MTARKLLRPHRRLRELRRARRGWRSPGKCHKRVVGHKVDVSKVKFSVVDRSTQCSCAGLRAQQTSKVTPHSTPLVSCAGRGVAAHRQPGTGLACYPGGLSRHRRQLEVLGEGNQADASYILLSELMPICMSFQ